MFSKAHLASQQLRNTGMKMFLIEGQKICGESETHWLIHVVSFIRSRIKNGKYGKSVKRVAARMLNAVSQSQYQQAQQLKCVFITFIVWVIFESANYLLFNYLLLQFLQLQLKYLLCTVLHEVVLLLRGNNSFLLKYIYLITLFTFIYRLGLIINSIHPQIKYR